MQDLWLENYIPENPQASHVVAHNSDFYAGAQFFFATPTYPQRDTIGFGVLPGVPYERLPYAKGRIEVRDDLPPGFAYGSAVKHSHIRFANWLFEHGTRTTVQAFCMASYDFADDSEAGDILATHRAYSSHEGWVYEVVQARPMLGKAIPSALDVLTAGTFHLAVKTGWNTPPSHAIYRMPADALYLVPRPPLDKYVRWWVDHRASAPTVEGYLRPGTTRLTWETGRSTSQPQGLRIHGNADNAAYAIWQAVSTFYRQHSTFTLQ